MANLLTINECIRSLKETADYNDRLLLVETVVKNPKVAHEIVSIGSGLSGASLAAAWASLGAAATASSVSGMLLAAGFTNPATLSAAGTVAAGLVAAATIAAGGRLAYVLAKDASRGVFNPAQSQRALGDLIDVVVKRDKALNKNDADGIIKYTTKMKTLAKKLHEDSVADLKKHKIDQHTYRTYLKISEKGMLGRLSNLA